MKDRMTDKLRKTNQQSELGIIFISNLGGDFYITCSPTQMKELPSVLNLTTDKEVVLCE